jgi:beta-lactamase class A
MDAKEKGLDRRRLVRLGGLGLALGPAAMLPDAALAQQRASGPIPGLLDGFLALPGTKAAQIDVGDGGNAWRVAHAADAELFCGSCFKTFVLATYLREVEAGRLSLDEQLTIDDRTRSTGGAVFEHLTGTTQARIVLEAMIAHSDNTATDVAMGRVGVDKVRAFIAEAALKGVRIPDNTRRFFSYLAGYPQGTDMGIEGLRAMAADKAGPGPMRQALNDVDTMVCPAATFVDYYKRALAGAYFERKETLVELKRILAMADAIAVLVPAGTPAYMKGGSIDWNGFHCLAAAGQMIARGVPVTFALMLNWRDSDGDAAAVGAAFKGAAADMLARVRTRIVKGST